MKRWSILIVALLIGAAAPVRAWCEATCIAPAESAQSSHCPSHEAPADDGPRLSAPATVECPAIEAARPVPAKLHLTFDTLIAVASAARTTPTRARTTAVPRVRGLRIFDTDIPLRV